MLQECIGLVGFSEGHVWSRLARGEQREEVGLIMPENSPGKKPGWCLDYMVLMLIK